ncbi:MAG: DUF192 domain-containing protein [Aigarchaeota archaeon]|nr:DUF192 domain-containing protein [Candidatus Pelearchaeum maunauluense]
MRVIFLAFVAGLVLGLFVGYVFLDEEAREGFGGGEYGFVMVGDVLVRVEIADTPEERIRGLSGRESLKPGWGMLFIFPQEGIYSFWMYGMRFSLDIIWIDEDGYVVYVVEKAPPCKEDGECPSYTPDEEALYVLEVAAGFVEDNNVREGQRIRIFLPAV